jgi:hypothetical protein
MPIYESVLIAGLFVNTLGLAVVLFKLVWGSSSSLQMQFNEISKEFSSKLDVHVANFGNVIQNVMDRFHKIELAAMESRAVAAETYMRRDSYYKATDEFKRDVQAAHTDLKVEVREGFERLEAHVDDLAKSIAAR